MEAKLIKPHGTQTLYVFDADVELWLFEQPLATDLSIAQEEFMRVSNNRAIVYYNTKKPQTKRWILLIQDQKITNFILRRS